MTWRQRQSRRNLSYPQFTGSEPCATIGFQFYYVEKGSYTAVERDTMRDACVNQCPMYTACLEWALHRERWGYWAGTTEIDREQLRRERGILLTDPPVVVPTAQVVDDVSAA